MSEYYTDRLNAEYARKLQEIMAACVALHTAGALPTTYCPSTDGPTWHYTACLQAIKRHLGRRLTEAEMTALAATRAYGPTPLLTDDEAAWLYEDLQVDGRIPCRSWLQLAGAIETLFDDRMHDASAEDYAHAEALRAAD